MYLYILENSLSGIFYIGITLNLDKRIAQHNSQKTHFTGKINGNWKLIFSKLYKTKLEAKQEELRLKRARNKKYIRWYIDNHGPLAQR